LSAQAVFGCDIGAMTVLNSFGCIIDSGCTERTGGSLIFYAFWEPNMFFEYLEKPDK